MAVDGAGVPRRIKDEIVGELAKDNQSWTDVVREGVKSLAGTHPKALARRPPQLPLPPEHDPEEMEDTEQKTKSLGLQFASVLTSDLSSSGSSSTSSNPTLPLSVKEQALALQKDVDELESLLGLPGASERLQLENPEKGQDLDGALNEVERQVEEVTTELKALETKPDGESRESKADADADTGVRESESPASVESQSQPV
jgi:hypothetical protein